MLALYHTNRAVISSLFCPTFLKNSAGFAKKIILSNKKLAQNTESCSIGMLDSFFGSTGTNIFELE